MKINKIYIDQAVADYPVTIEIIRRMKHKHFEYVADTESVFRLINAFEDPESAGKRSLLLTLNKGHFVRKCPGTTHYTCCNYHILHIGSYCSMDCSYCILQAYFHPPLLTFFVNHEEMKKSLEGVFFKSEICRMGTGEFTDSMIWENVYPIASKLVRMFAGRRNAVLELKTKTSEITSLLGLKHQGNTIMSWSLNTPRVIREQERRTAFLNDRISAAAACQSVGYPLAFHFDPLFWYEGCEAEYNQVIEKLFSRIDPAGIAWISLGSFRYMPQLSEIIERRFPGSNIIYGEFIRGLDSKMRYFKPLRIRLYQSIVTKIKEMAPDVILYFCMEDDEVWSSVLGYTPSEHGGVSAILDRSATRHCNLRPVSVQR